MIPTARKLLETKETFDEDYPTVSIHDAIEMSLELAKLHCIEQARIISKKAKISYEGNEEEKFGPCIDKNSILTAYSLDLIK